MSDSRAATLYDYWRSSSAYRVRIALGVLGLAYETVAVDLVAGDQTAGANLARNPQGLVPTLDIDGIRLTQSLAIIEYLDETRAAGFLPKDPADRARVRTLAMAIAMEIQPICNLRVARHAVAQSDGKIDQAAWMRHFIANGLQAFEALLPGEVDGYCFGNRVSLADICLVPQVYNARRWEVDMTALPKCSAIDANLQRLPGFAAAVPELHRP